MYNIASSRLCAFNGCYQDAFSKGLCRTHYWQQYVGRPLTPIRFHGKNLTPKIRFDRLWRLNAATQCWEWEGAMHPRGYGMFWWNAEVKTMYAHRAAWALYNGEIPDDLNHVYRTLHVLHHCDNGRCVNPDHLFLGTPTDNMHDYQRKHGPLPRNPLRGEEHPSAKVTADIVRAIRDSTRSDAVLGRQYGIARGTVGEIRRREIWRHVAGEARERTRAIEFLGTVYTSIKEASNATGLTVKAIYHRLGRGRARYIDD